MGSVVYCKEGGGKGERRKRKREGGDPVRIFLRYTRGGKEKEEGGPYLSSPIMRVSGEKKGKKEG